MRLPNQKSASLSSILTGVCDYRFIYFSYYLTAVCVCIIGVLVDNRRYICLRFTAQESIMMHGFAGYFDTTLYDNIRLSETLTVVNPLHSVDSYSSNSMDYTMH